MKGAMAEGPREREPAAADKATLATPPGMPSGSPLGDSQGRSRQGVGASSRRSQPYSPRDSASSPVSAEYSRPAQAGVATAERSDAVIDVMRAHVSASIDVATGGPVAVSAASDLEAAMRLTSNNGPLIEQSVSSRGRQHQDGTTASLLRALPPHVPTKQSVDSSKLEPGGSNQGSEGGGEVSQLERASLVSMDDGITVCDGGAARDGDSQVRHSDGKLCREAVGRVSRRNSARCTDY